MTKQTLADEFSVFSQKTVQRLEAAGWSPDRVVNVSIYKAAFLEEDLPFPKSIRDFLAVFGGLVITYTTRRSQDDTVDFLAEEAVQGLGGGVLRPYERLANNQQLFPIGHTGDGMTLLLMTSRGAVFAGVDWRVRRIGNTGPEAIENIVSGELLDIIGDSVATVSAPEASQSEGEIDANFRLTKGECEVLRKVAIGLKNREIARDLQISVDAVKEHVNGILQKLALRDRNDAVMWAKQSGLAAHDD